MYVKAVRILKRNTEGDLTWHPALHVGGFDADEKGNVKKDIIITKKGELFDTLKHNKERKNYVEDKHLLEY